MWPVIPESSGQLLLGTVLNIKLKEIRYTLRDDNNMDRVGCYKILKMIIENFL